MAEKVKISREVAEALQTVLPNGNISGCIEKHVRGWDYEPKLPLNKLSTEEFARCCLIGYEIEETPEEQLASVYQRNKGSLILTNEGLAEGIKFTLEMLNIKIKGINE
ncbi:MULTISPECIES: hypothetical protein [unclassified Lysinibacillus]|uniref:hypothetical protein n=1 Tax=unclassified Lysinibacillus TaxID=2636778 RepID=UPI00088B31D7|nr:MULTISPECIES: hypothetical protein [unclassified Lysinibacillus]SCY99219.1 hypothetical protein SAMN02787078_03460 [Lysinibacillus sp. SG9]SDB46989.1 hypothetical protein SAMN02787079_03603 [Lysinibacillus sp. TC-37]SFT12531.1 hypothetical protein SAMN02787087_03762 [Lysinibacillus sp. SG55]